MLQMIAIDMKVLSVRQPWAWCIIHAGKDVENRPWRTDYRGTVIIHAAKAFDSVGYNWLLHTMPDIRLPSRDEFERGGIIGATKLIGCITPMARVVSPPELQPFHDSRWFHKRDFGLVLSTAHAYTTPLIPCKGRLGLLDVSHYLPADHQLIKDLVRCHA